MSLHGFMAVRQPRDIFSRPRRRADEEIVQNGLAVTPEDMLTMAEAGLPITPQNLGLAYDDGYSDLDFDVPLQHQRGVDLGDAWEAEQRSKKLLAKAKANGLLNHVAPDNVLLSNVISKN